MVRAVKKPIVSKEELKFREELYPDVKAVKNKNILCTSCNVSLKELILRGKPRTHPFLDTLLCEKCNSFFGDGDFSVDEDGSDKYCRWCGQGGTLFLCSKCTAGFCKKCIKRNLPRTALKEVDADDWQCYCCNVKPLYELRAHCWAANKFASEFVNNEELKRKRGKKSTEQDNSDSESELDDSRRPKRRKKADDSSNEDEPKSVRSKGRQKKVATDNKNSPSVSREDTKKFRPIIQKLALTLKDAISMTDLFKKRATDLTNKKINANCIKDVNSVVQISGKVDTLLQSVETISQQLRASVEDTVTKWRKLHDPDVVDEESEEGKSDEEIGKVDEEEGKADEEEAKNKSINGVMESVNEVENKDADEVGKDEKTDIKDTDDLRTGERTSPMNVEVDEEKHTPKKTNGSDSDGHDDIIDEKKENKSSESLDGEKAEEVKSSNNEKQTDEDGEGEKRKLENNGTGDVLPEDSSSKKVSEVDADE